MELDNDILVDLPKVEEVSNPQPGFEYCWVQCVHRGSFHIRQKQVMGFEVVTGDAPEARELKDEAGLRRCGDTILMRITTERADRLRRYNQRQASRFDQSVLGNIIELGRKHNVRVVTDPNDPVLKRGFMRASAQAEAQRQVTGMIQRGTVPGMPAPGQA
jgi:hypothetical protein